jgi:hypothetical protein
MRQPTRTVTLVEAWRSRLGAQHHFNLAGRSGAISCYPVRPVSFLLCFEMAEGGSHKQGRVDRMRFAYFSP